MEKSLLILPTRALSLGPELGLDRHMSADTPGAHAAPRRATHVGVSPGGTHLGSCQLHLSPPTGKHVVWTAAGRLLTPAWGPREAVHSVSVSRTLPGELGSSSELLMNWVLQRGMRAGRTLGAPGICVMHVAAQNPHSGPIPTSYCGLWGGPRAGQQRQLRQKERFLKNHQHKLMENWENYPEGRKNCNHSSLLKMSC